MHDSKLVAAEIEPLLAMGRVCMHAPTDEDREKSVLSRMPVHRWGLPDDFKGPVVFLASEASRYVTGKICMVDRGWIGR